MNAVDVMRESIAKVNEDTNFLDAVRILLETNQRALPVVDENDAIVGILSEGDLMNCVEPDAPSFKSILETMGFLFPHAREVRLKSLTVRDLMTPNPVCVGEEDTVDEIVALMTDHEIAQVPVVSEGFILGIVTRAELLAYIERRLRQEDAGEIEHAA